MCKGYDCMFIYSNALQKNPVLLLTINKAWNYPVIYFCRFRIMLFLILLSVDLISRWLCVLESKMCVNRNLSADPKAQKNDCLKNCSSIAFFLRTRSWNHIQPWNLLLWFYILLYLKRFTRVFSPYTSVAVSKIYLNSTRFPQFEHLQQDFASFFLCCCFLNFLLLVTQAWVQCCLLSVHPVCFLEFIIHHK